MKHRIFFLALLVPASVLALLNCDSDSDAPPSGVDAAIDVTTADTNTPNEDSGTNTDTGAPDTSTSDTGPVFDERGCPVQTVAPSDATAEGLPASGLVLWLRADRGVSTFDGGAVCHWQDVSGGNHPFVSSQDASTPSLAPNGLSNKPAISVVGTNQWLVRGDVEGIAPSSARTLIAFGKVADKTTRFAYLNQGDFSTNNIYFGLDQNTFQSSGSREGVYMTGNAFDSNAVTDGGPHTHIYSASTMARDSGVPGVLTYTVDDVTTTLTHTPGGNGKDVVLDFASANRTTIGSAQPGFAGGLIGEILLYNRELTPVERTAVNAYFKKRYP